MGLYGRGLNSMRSGRNDDLSNTKVVQDDAMPRVSGGMAW